MPRLLSLALALIILGTVVPTTTPGPPASPVDQEPPLDLVIHGFPPGDEPEAAALGTFGGVIALQPGETVVLSLGVYDYERCGVSVQCFIPVPVRATWSIAPAGGARIDAASGELTIESGTPSGTQLTVTATIDDGRHAVSTEIYVYTPEGNPLVGLWREGAQVSCDGGAELSPELRIEELVFAADGSFAVTWQPFESYVDYWGTYAFDVDEGTLALVVTGGNFVPDDVDGQGRFAVDDSVHLALTGVWLGTSHSGDGPPNCGHRFSR